MKRALIIDDEHLAIDNIKILLNTLDPSIEVVGEASNVIDAVKKYKDTQPNLVFLDINMPNGNGFDFLECVDFENSKVVFVTAHDDFAIKAIKYNVFDYLVKPIDIDLLEATLHRFDKEIQKAPLNINSKAPEIETQKIGFSTADEIVYLNTSDIIYCESDNSYCTIHTKDDNKILISSSLQKVHDKLNQDFFRTHQSYLINKNEILKYLKQENKILLSNGHKVPVSKTHKKDLMDIMIG